MKYIEKGFIKINKSPIKLLFKLLFSNVVLDIIAIIILAIDYMSMVSKGHSVFSLEEYFFFGILGVQLIMIIYLFIKWMHEYYIFEDNKLTYYSGIIFKKKREFILNKIGCTTFEQSLMGKIFNYGDIFIHVQNEIFKLKNISDPNQFIKLIGKLKDKE